MGLKSVLITGANRGLGLEFVRQLANSDTLKPAHIFACCRDPSKADALKCIAREMAAEGPKIHVVMLDVTNDAHISEAVKYVGSVVGEDGLNLLLNNAGVLIPEKSRLPDVDRQRALDHFNVNTIGPLMVAQAFLELLGRAAQANQGDPMSVYKAAVINISSGVGSISDNTTGAARLGYGYRMSKAALNMATKCLSVDMKNSGIMFVSVCPGWVSTDMGGPAAHITPIESVSAILDTMRGFDEKHNGGFYKRDGTVFPF